ncbi:MAG TPA: hypothetical protein DHW71_08400 [Gammaproteobacteria bacterium]|nr:hypothetical protein [Pseudomonadota bacterium]HBF09637.1 hypothetical protein [Gammaproteobacteria bacterium]HCK92992.1 hypothetical protein [Gammaproteobacteria bacterium]|tara:strand:+ start:335 stop:712 length:378 start_codon:yes stop_codon:yes gene_type:complete
MSLAILRHIIRFLHVLYIAVTIYWVFQTTSADINPVVIALFQVFPLLLIAPIFIKFKPALLYIALPIIMIYLCFLAPNLFRDGPETSIAFIELSVNLLLTGFIMWYQLKASKNQRQKTAEYLEKA